jgi:hypothetical protein
MTDEAAGSGPGDQWRDVMKGVDEFGDAVARWVRASVNDPRNRERAEELRTHLGGVAEKVSEAVRDVSQTEAGQSVRSAASQAGEAFKQAGTRVSAEVAPSLADMFRSAAAGLDQAASRMEARTDDAGTVASEDAPGSVEAPGEASPDTSE